MPSRHEDLQRLTRLAVQRLVDGWTQRYWELRPWGMWLMLHGAITDHEELEDIHSTAPVRATWFLTESGFVRREDWSALRYLTLRQTEPTRRGLVLATGVGHFTVAPYRDQLAVYAAAHYGALNAGGFQLEFDAHGEPIEQRLWVA